ncbi:MAG TPA: hypothetical protein VE987_06030 [Polyangiaceae bacterium]|nr:hypothetical protein [Polyangiaceae bacterium]
MHIVPPHAIGPVPTPLSIVNTVLQVDRATLPPFWQTSPDGHSLLVWQT